MDEKLKLGIASIRFPMALLVVLIHCTLNTEHPFLKAFMNGGESLRQLQCLLSFSFLDIYSKRETLI